MRVDNRSITQESKYRSQPDFTSLSRWSPSLWLNTLLEKHAWLSAGLVWMQGASQSADVGVYNDTPPSESDPRPTLSLFEHWEEGAHLPIAINARDYSFPSSLVVPFTWLYATEALSLRDAINNVSHGERQAWGQASLINLVPGVNYPNQPRSDPDSHLSDPLTYWWGVTLCPPELNDVALAETVVILMRYAAIREIFLNTEVQKPTIADVLEFKGKRIECAIESTPHEDTRIHSPVYDGGSLMPEFEENGQETLVDEEIRGRTYPIRAEGEYATTENPWPRDEVKESRDIAGMQKRKPYPHRRQGNRWDQYGESSSAASSEAHIASDNVHSESTWGPFESANKDKRAAQPYRLQKANKSDGQWSRWASDIRRSQPDQRSDSSSKWRSSAGDDSSWKKVSEWEGAQWSAPTRRTLKGSDYETDREWHSRNMRYGDGWAYDSTQSHYKRAKPTWTDPEDDRKADSSLPIGSTSKTYDPQKDHTFWQRKDSSQGW